MNTIRLGQSELQVAPFAFGGNVFGWTADQRRSFELLDAYVDAGFSLVDTADVYSRWVEGHQGGESETILGQWIASRGRRDRIVIATKLGMDMGPGMEGLSRKYIFDAVDRSLDRLQTDYIDLYQAHRDDENTPLEETLDAFSELIDAGKVRAIGASNYSADRLREALDVSERNNLPRYETLQLWYNLYDRGMFEGPLADVCRERSISVVPFFSLASGFLTGKYRTEADLEGSARAYRVKAMMNERGQRILHALDAVAAERNAKPAQIALAWLRGRGIAAPLASATSLAQLDEILASVEIELTADQMQRLTTASDGFPDTPDGPNGPPGRD